MADAQPDEARPPRRRTGPLPRWALLKAPGELMGLGWDLADYAGQPQPHGCSGCEAAVTFWPPGAIGPATWGWTKAATHEPGCRLVAHLARQGLAQWN